MFDLLVDCDLVLKLRASLSHCNQNLHCTLHHISIAHLEQHSCIWRLWIILSHKEPTDPKLSLQCQRDKCYSCSTDSLDWMEADFMNTMTVSEWFCGDFLVLRSSFVFCSSNRHSELIFWVNCHMHCKCRSCNYYWEMVFFSIVGREVRYLRVSNTYGG